MLVEEAVDTVLVQLRSARTGSAVDEVPVAAVVSRPDVVGHLCRVGQFVGREKQFQAVGDHIRLGHQVITVVGIPGVGKTRLASEVLRAVGGLFVEVSSLSGSQLRAEVDATLQPGAHPQELVVLDGFIPDEHCASFLDVLATRRGVTFLLTSCEPLGIRGEALVELDGLATADSGPSDALTLLVQHLLLNDPSFVVSDSNERELHALTKVLDGSPLGIEIVAARLHRKSLPDVMGELSLNLATLKRVSRDVPTRHLSLSAAIETTLSTCRPDAVEVLRFVAAFGRVVTTATLHSVWATRFPDHDVDELLQYLIDRRLLCFDGDASSVAVLFTVAAVLGGSNESVQQQFLSTVADVVETKLSDLSRGVPEAFRLLEKEAGLLRATVDLLASRNDERLVGLVVGLRQWWRVTGRSSDAYVWATRCLDAGVGVDGGVSGEAVRWSLLSMAFDVVVADSDYERARELIEREPQPAELEQRLLRFLMLGELSAKTNHGDDDLGVAPCPLDDDHLDAVIRIRGFRVQAQLAGCRGEYGEAVRLMQRGIAVAVAHQDLHWSLVLRGELVVLHQAGGTEEFESMVSESLELADIIGSESPQQAMLVAELAHSQYQRRRFTTAFSTVNRAVEISSRVSNELDQLVIRELAAIIGAETLPLEEVRAQFSELLDTYVAKGAEARIRSLLRDIAILSVGLSPKDCYLVFRVLDVAVGADYWSQRQARVLLSLEKKLSGSERRMLDKEALGLGVEALTRRVTAGLRSVRCEDLRFPGLSARESDVARLVADGLTDKAISERLVLGVRTVNTHVASILRKAGLSSRGEVKDWLFNHRTDLDQLPA